MRNEPVTQTKSTYKKLKRVKTLVKFGLIKCI